MRIENVMEAPGRLKGGSVASRHRKRHVLKLDRAGDASRYAVADPDSPGMTVGVATQRTEFAKIDHRAGKTFIAQEVGDGVGDEALRDAVEGYAHAGALKPDAGTANIDLPEIHEIACHVAGAGRDIRLDIAVRPEMRFIKPPQRLHRDVEGAVAQQAEASAFLDKPAQLRRRFTQCACRIKARDFTVLPVEAEYALVAGDLATDPQDGALRQRGVGVPQRELRQRAQHFALPTEQLPGRRGSARRRDQHRQPGRRREDADGTPARWPAIRPSDEFSVTHFQPSRQPEHRAAPPRAAWPPAPAADSAPHHNTRPGNPGTENIPP